MIIDEILRKIIYPRPMLEYLILTAPRRYKVYNIPKRNGKGCRTIAQPTRLVKTIQKECIEYLLIKCPIHFAATAYVATKSIRDNAIKHKNNNFMLKMDFKNFFNNITEYDLKKYIKKHHNDCDIPWTDKDCEDLCNILFWRPKNKYERILSIGAPSSPALSNILMYDFDENVSKFCSENNVVYTRYADDLTFSCNEAFKLKDIEKYVKDVVQSIDFPTLIINEDKTVHTSKKKNRHITGITITNDGQLSLGYKRKIVLKSLIHKYINNELDKKKILYLCGMLNFAISIEPEFVQRMQNKYGKEVIMDIRKYQ